MSNPQSRKSVVRDAKGRVTSDGGSLNPGGVPKWLRLLRKSLESTAPEGAELLRDIIRGKPLDAVLNGEKVSVTPSVENRIRAVEVAFSYVVAKPKQSVNVDADATGAKVTFTIDLGGEE